MQRILSSPRPEELHCVWDVQFNRYPAARLCEPVHVSVRQQIRESFSGRSHFGLLQNCILLPFRPCVFPGRNELQFCSLPWRQAPVFPL